MKRIIEIQHIKEVIPLLEARPHIKAVFFDIDNTLTASHSQEVAAEVHEVLAKLRQRELKMALVSNNTRERVEKFAAIIGLPAYFLARKPLPFALRRAVADLGLQPQQCMFIGDQIITDIFAALLAGVEAVLVYPYSRSSDGPWQNFFSRRIERHIFRRKI